MVVLTKTNPYTAQLAHASTTPAPHGNLLVRAGFGKVCGYENGNPQLPLGCPAGYDCKHDGAARVSGCCNTAATATTCALETTCIDYTNAPTSSIPRAHTCDESQPICVTGYFIDGYSMFTCGTGTQQTQVSLFYHAPSQTTASSNSYSQPTNSSPRPTHNFGTSTKSTGSSSSTPTGAIAGGVVGGVVVVAIVVFFLFYIPRRKRKTQSTAAATATTTPSADAKEPPTYPEESKQLPAEKEGVGYSELEAPPAEMPGKAQHLAHEVPYQPASPSAVGRSELYGS